MSPYAIPAFLIKKKSGEPRLVVDCRALNKQTERIHFPLPNIDDQLSRLGDSTMFITLDLSMGYLQVPLTKEARAKTAFITSDNTGEFTRMVFGLMNAPFYFSKLMPKVLNPLKDENVLFYLDDLLCDILRVIITNAAYHVVKLLKKSVDIINASEINPLSALNHARGLINRHRKNRTAFSNGDDKKGLCGIQTSSCWRYTVRYSFPYRHRVRHLIASRGKKLLSR